VTLASAAGWAAWAGIAAAALALSGTGARLELIGGCFLAGLVLAGSAWSSARKRRRRWREVEHLERSLFVTANSRKRWRTRS